MNGRAFFTGVQLSADQLYAEVDRIKKERARKNPNWNSTNPKLSVDYADGVVKQEQNTGADLHRGSRFQGRRDEVYKNGFDTDFSDDRIRSMLQGKNSMRNTTKHEQFTEGVRAVEEQKNINGYIFGDVLGQGSFAKVQEAVHETTLVRRAVKIIKHNPMKTVRKGTNNALTEITILRKVNHKNVIRIIEVFPDEKKKHLYVVLEFCMGSLQQRIESSPLKHLPESETHLYFCQLIEGMEYIHSVGIVHKDIKPTNLLLGTDFSLKISDFGVAEALSPYQVGDMCTIVQGTPKFQAPELVSGNFKTFSGFKSDVWSAGVTLYNMASGQYPFEGEAFMIYQNITTKPLNMPVGIMLDKQLQSLLIGMMKKKPACRYDINAIKNSKWFQKDFHKETQSFEQQRSARRPHTVNGALEMMYAKQPPKGMNRNEEVANRDVASALDETVASVVSSLFHARF